MNPELGYWLENMPGLRIEVVYEPRRPSVVADAVSRGPNFISVNSVKKRTRTMDFRLKEATGEYIMKSVRASGKCGNGLRSKVRKTGRKAATNLRFCSSVGSIKRMGISCGFH